MLCAETCIDISSLNRASVLWCNQPIPEQYSQCTTVAASYEDILSTATGNEIPLVVGYTAINGNIYSIALDSGNRVVS